MTIHNIGLKERCWWCFLAAIHPSQMQSVTQERTGLNNCMHYHIKMRAEDQNCYPAWSWSSDIRRTGHSTDPIMPHAWQVSHKSANVSVTGVTHPHKAGFFFCIPQLYVWGSQFWERFLHMWPFSNPTIEVVTFHLRGWCIMGVFVAGIDHSRTWMSGSLESMRWNACVHRLDLGLYSHPKEFWGMESEPMLTPRE